LSEDEDEDEDEWHPSSNAPGIASGMALPPFLGRRRGALGPLRADLLRPLKFRATPALMPATLFEPEVVPVVEDDFFDRCPRVFVAATDAPEIIVVLRQPLT
jgi:hypothetical protein